MDKILSKDTIKNVFSALGAKTSDSNYGVALLDKTSGEPKGFMGMSDLASVLGVPPHSSDFIADANDLHYGFKRIDATCQHLPSNISNPFYGTILAFDCVWYICQFLVSTSNVLYIRMFHGNNWNNWVKFTGTSV